MDSLPAINYFELARAATTATSARAFLTVGGGVLLASLLLNVGLEIWKTNAGHQEKSNYAGPIGQIMFYGFLLVSYHWLVPYIIYVINSLGTFDSASGRAEDVFLQRTFHFMQYMQDSTTEAGFLSSFTFENMRLGLMQIVAWLSYLLTFAVIYILKHLQVFMQQTIINFGPILIGFAALGTIFRNLALSWFWALVEVAFWGVTMNILLTTFSTTPVAVSGKTPTLWTEITINIVYAVCVCSVPLITASLIRGQSMVAVGQKVSTAVMATGTLATAAAISATRTAVHQAGMAAKQLAPQRQSSSGGGGTSLKAARGSDSDDAAKSLRRHHAIQDALKKRKGD